MDKARKIIIFSLTRTGCIEYTIEMLHAFEPYNPKIIVSKSSAYRYKGTFQTINTYTGIVSYIFSTINFLFNSKKIVQELKREFGDIVIYLPSFHYWNYIIVNQAKKASIPCYLTIHDYKTHIGEKSKFVEWVQKKTMEISTTLVFLSENEIKKALKDGFTIKNIFHLPHPIFKVKKVNDLAYNAKPNLLFIGRMVEYKGIDILIDAVQNLNIEKLTIAGSGKITSQPNKKIKIQNKYLSDNEINRLLETHEILILPYLEATQSGILSLGLSKNMVMVISDHQGLREQISQDSCLWVQPTKSSLIEQIERLISDKVLFDKIKENIKKDNVIIKKEWINTFEILINQMSSSSNIH